MKRFLRMILCALLILTVVILPAIPTASAASVYKMKVVGSNVRLRSGPSTSDDVITKLSNGTQVFYNGSSKHGFYKVTLLNGTTGYIYKDYLSTENKYSRSTVYKVSSKTYLYTKASTTKGHRTKTLYKGDYLVISKWYKGWAYVKTTSGKKGYVMTSKIKKAF